MAEPFQIEIGVPSSLIQTSNFSCTSFNVLVRCLNWALLIKHSLSVTEKKGEKLAIEPNQILIELE